MSKITQAYALMVIQTALGLLLMVSSFLLWVVFPRGYFPARLLWAGIHQWSGLALGVAVFLHVVLHWGWMVRMTRRYLALARGRTQRRCRRRAATEQGSLGAGEA